MPEPQEISSLKPRYNYQGARRKITTMQDGIISREPRAILMITTECFEHELRKSSEMYSSVEKGLRPKLTLIHKGMVGGSEKSLCWSD